MKLNAVTIRTILFERDIKQQELANMAKLGRSTVVAVCNGRSCSGDSALKIADALGVPLEQLLKR